MIFKKSLTRILIRNIFQTQTGYEYIKRFIVDFQRLYFNLKNAHFFKSRNNFVIVRKSEAETLDVSPTY